VPDGDRRERGAAGRLWSLTKGRRGQTGLAMGALVVLIGKRRRSCLPASRAR